MGPFASIAIILVGLWLLSHEEAGLGLFGLAFGVFFLWQDIRRRRILVADDRQMRSAGDHADEVNQRVEKGESIDQIAQALDTQYRIPPIQTLKYMALDRLQALGRGQNVELTQLWLNWFGACRPEPLPDPVADLAAIDPRLNLLGASAEISHTAEDHAEPLKGGLVATRTHLYFLPVLHEESFGVETAKETVMHALPFVVGAASLAKTMVEGVKAELTDWKSPKLIAELQHRLARPGGIAVPWREVVGVGKDATKGKTMDKVHLVVAHGAPAAPTLSKFSRGMGLDESWVDDWIDGIRMACLLEGRLLDVR